MNWKKGLIIGTTEYLDEIEVSVRKSGFRIGRVSGDDLEEALKTSISFGQEVVLIDGRVKKASEICKAIKEFRNKTLIIYITHLEDIRDELKNHPYADVVAKLVPAHEMNLLFRGKKPIMYVPCVGFRSKGSYVIVGPTGDTEKSKMEE